jgi:hypothetical protein
MSKRTIGIFFIISIIMDIVGVGLIIGGFIGSTYNTSYYGNTTNAQVTSMGHPALFAIGVILAFLSFIPFLIAWIGALINLARLQEWVWLVLMIIFSWITMIIYLIAGPTTRRAPQYAQSMPPQQQPPYPQTPYPQQPQYNPEAQTPYPQQPQYNPEAQTPYPQQPQYNPQQQQSYPQQDYRQPPQNSPQQDYRQPPQNSPQPPQSYPQQDYRQPPQNNPQPPQNNPQT